MIGIAVVFPVTGLAVAGYIVFYCANQSTGAMRLFGRIIGTWTYVLAVGLIVAVATGMVPQRGMMGREGMQRRDMGPGATYQRPAPPGPQGPPPPPGPPPPQ